MQQNFIHLRLHTEYSLQDGLLTIPSLLKKAHSVGMPAIAITDLGNLYGTIKFYQAAIATGIKPIIGIDCLIRDQITQSASRCTLLCQTHPGYRNLLQLISQSFLEGERINNIPILERAWLKKYNHGLLMLSGAEEGDIGQAILNHRLEQAKKYLEEWQSLFPNRFYIEMRRIGKTTESAYIPAAVELANAYSIPIVATNDIRFMERNDFEAHEARVCIQEGVVLNDPNRSHRYTEQQYFRTPEDMQTLFADLPEALENTIEIAKRCNVFLELGKNQLPHFTVPENYTADSYLSEAANRGLNERLFFLYDKTAPTFENIRRVYDARLSRELDVINTMGFAGYFLIVADFTRWAKEHDIPVGPGRGSGPGSLVAYALSITDFDPLAFDLLFERFLNPERVSLPDFDIDFCIEGRDRVIEYVMERHGHECVSQIMTYGTMAAKAVVRDVGRVLALPYGFVDKIAKLIPFELGMTLDLALSQEPLLRERYEQEEEVRTLIDLARKLEGIARNVGKHAGGIVIAPGPLTHFLPLYCETNDAAHPVTQFDKDDVEAVGLIKFDFLGLTTLTIIHQALLVINATRKINQESPIDISRISLQDAETFSLLKNRHSTAVFQLESHGMQELIKRLKPDCFEDLIALVALFRPGPLQSGMVDDFVNRKHGRSQVFYPHPKLEPILRPTYGVILYQEQVMQIAQVLAGYTLGAADILRRAMGKKKAEEMANQRESFCQGAIKNGVGKETATHIFDLMEKFAGYGFNKSHSAAYALIAYQTAWLKAHYPTEFMAAVLSADMDKTEKVLYYLKECRSLELTILPPDINHSVYRFQALNNKTICYGLGAIKGIGQTAVDNIAMVREKEGPFKNLFDFCKRIDLHKNNRRTLEALIKSGSLDTIDSNRAQLKASLNHALSHAEQTLHDQTSGQQDLLAACEPTHSAPTIITAPWTDAVRLQGEKETLGFYLSGHPVNAYLDELLQFVTCRLNALDHIIHKSARLAGIVTHIRIKQTKRGDRIAIFALDDGESSIEVVCFSEPFQKFRSLIVEDKLLVIEGECKLDEFSNQPRITARIIYSLEEARSQFAKSLMITLNDEPQREMSSFQSLLTPYLGGSCLVQFNFLQAGLRASIKLDKKWSIKPLDALLAMLREEMQVEVMY